MVIARVSVILLLLTLSVAPISAQTSRRIKTGGKRLTSAQVPLLTLEIGSVVPRTEGVKRSSVRTVCAGDQVPLRARLSEAPNSQKQYAWTSSSGQIIGQGEEVLFDTTGLTPGDYHITAQVSYRSSGVCGGDCTAYDSKTIRVSSCPPLTICFLSPELKVTPETSTVQPGEAVALSTSGPEGGQGYGSLTYVWRSSAGMIFGQGPQARLDTTGVAPETRIEVTVTVLSEVGECAAKGSARVVMAAPPAPPRSYELAPCLTFKHNSARVDNACKYVLTDAARALQADARARLVITAFHHSTEAAAIAAARGKNVRDRLLDGSLGIKVDAHRMIVRDGGLTKDGRQIQLTFVPDGASLPDGPPEISFGQLEREKKTEAKQPGSPARPATRRRAASSQVR